MQQRANQQSSDAAQSKKRELRNEDNQVWQSDTESRARPFLTGIPGRLARNKWRRVENSSDGVTHQILPRCSDYELIVKENCLNSKWNSDETAY